MAGKLFRTKAQEQRDDVRDAIDGGIDGRLAKSIAEVSKSTGIDPAEFAKSLVDNINGEIARRRAAGYYDPWYKKVWRRLKLR